MFAASRGGTHRKAIKLLLDNGADIKIKTKDNDTFLHIVCRDSQKHDQVITYLKLGADPTVVNSSGETPASILSQFGEDTYNEIQYIAHHYKNVKVSSGLLSAFEENDFETFSLLLQNKSSPNAKYETTDHKEEYLIFIILESDKSLPIKTKYIDFYVAELSIII